jgi:hypothetical protein
LCVSKEVVLAMGLLRSVKELDSEPGPPCPDQDVCQHSYCCEANGSLDPELVELLSLFVSQAGNGCPMI